MVIKEASAQIEDEYPQTISYASILPFAARDSAYKAGQINYAIPTGPRDGCVFDHDEAGQNLPLFFSNIDQLIPLNGVPEYLELLAFSSLFSHFILVSECDKASSTGALISFTTPTTIIVQAAKTNPLFGSS
ncbi:peroxidase N1-like [Prosopis cineraria]|uniref:peroxidase N1-like n=1 Tax=Prosopis cineraria TaxID=364024 RepID=UPI00240EF546|nr:peroxidase N1-like [Prosopis cineraria]